MDDILCRIYVSLRRDADKRAAAIARASKMAEDSPSSAMPVTLPAKERKV